MVLKIVKSAIARIKHEKITVKREVLAILRTRKDYLNQPVNEFTRKGYEVIPDFLDQEECDRLIELADSYLSDRSYEIEGNCYLLCRKDIHHVDLNAKQLMNVQEIDEKLGQLFNSHVLEDIFEQQLGEKMHLQSISIKIDDLDTEYKRGYHTDGVGRALYKAFIYLNDVNEYGDGPYTLIPGSHRHRFRKLINYFYGWLLTLKYKQGEYNPKEDMKLIYNDRQSVSFFTKAGTLIMSNQQLAHKGWHNHDKKKRYALICYLLPEKDYSGKSFTMGKKAVLQEA